MDDRRWMRWALLALVATWGCGADAERARGEGSAEGATAGAAGGELGGGDAGGAGGAALAGPPAELAGGELAWVVSAPGAGYPVRVAAAPTGYIFVAATQTGAVTLGGLAVPAPVGGQGLLVLKLTPAGQPVWGRTIATAPAIAASGVALTSAGDPVIAGTRRTGTSASTDDGFVIALDGDDGAIRWSAPLAGGAEDRVAGIAAGFHADAGDEPPSARLVPGSLPGPGPAGLDAIYVYGSLGASATIAGDPFPAGAYLLRFDDNGALRWGLSLPPLAPSFGHPLALDPERGPVIAGRFSGTITLGSHVLTAEADYGSSDKDGVIAGFDRHGQVRFARQLMPVRSSISLNLSAAVGPGGEIYVASDTSGSQTVVDDHVIPASYTDDLSLLRLTPEGRYVSSKVIAGRQSVWSYDVKVDSAGAAYLIGRCEGKVDVQPEITCEDGPTRLLASYGADGAYRWATSVEAASVDSIAPAPANRLIVAGHAYASTLEISGVQVPVQPLFIASLGRGPARLPSPLPPPPVISSVKLDGILDRELRHGGAATLVIQGTGLDAVTRARLGELDVHVPAGAGTPTTLRLPIAIPHGHAPGWLRLELGNAGGAAQIADAVNVTPFVVSPAGAFGGRGTFASPIRLCDLDSFLLEHGDVLLLRNGVHTCNKSVPVRRGVIIRGESKTGAIVRGSSLGAFRGFTAMGGRTGTTPIERLTIEGPGTVALVYSGGRIAVTDVDVQGAWAGIEVGDGAVATVSRYSYRQSDGAALFISGGRVDASQVDVSGASSGVRMIRGTLNLASSSISTTGTAIEAGLENDHYGTRDVTISGTTLRSEGRGLVAIAARVTVTGSTIEALAGAGYATKGLDVDGGELVLGTSTVRGWETCVFAEEVFPDFGTGSEPMERAVRVTLDQVELAACRWGVYYVSGWYSATGWLDSRLRLHRARVTATDAAVTLRGKLAAADLGTAAAPGGNELATSAGGMAFVDERGAGGVDVDAHGTTLNGATFSGTVQGPVTVPGAYRIEATNRLRF